MRPIRLKDLLLLFACLLSSACSSKAPPGLTPEWLKGSDSPRVVAILPFDNLTSEPEIEVLVRESFYSQFALKSYRDVELKEVDRAIETFQRTSPSSWKDLPPKTLGRLLHADYLIYGKVLGYSRLFMGIYSRIRVKVQIEMVDCRSGVGVWWKTVSKSSHEGGVPFSPLSLIPDTIRSGLHMSREKSIHLLDRLSREIVAEIPEPGHPVSSPIFMDLQIGSFLERDLARKALLRLLEKGFHARIEPVNLGERTYHRVLLGPYRSAEEAQTARSAVVKELGVEAILVQHTDGQR